MNAARLPRPNTSTKNLKRQQEAVKRQQEPVNDVLIERIEAFAAKMEQGKERAEKLIADIEKQERSCKQLQQRMRRQEPETAKMMKIEKHDGRSSCRLFLEKLDEVQALRRQQKILQQQREEHQMNELPPIQKQEQQSQKYRKQPSKHYDSDEDYDSESYSSDSYWSDSTNSDTTSNIDNGSSRSNSISNSVTSDRSSTSSDHDDEISYSDPNVYQYQVNCSFYGSKNGDKTDDSKVFSSVTCSRKGDFTTINFKNDKLFSRDGNTNNRRDTRITSGEKYFVEFVVNKSIEEQQQKQKNYEKLSVATRTMNPSLISLTVPRTVQKKSCANSSNTTKGYHACRAGNNSEELFPAFCSDSSYSIVLSDYYSDSDSI